MTEAELLHRIDRNIEAIRKNTEVIREHVEASRGYMTRGNELEEVGDEMGAEPTATLSDISAAMRADRAALQKAVDRLESQSG